VCAIQEISFDKSIHLRPTLTAAAPLQCERERDYPPDWLASIIRAWATRKDDVELTCN
jgi:hypothetical protein